MGQPSLSTAANGHLMLSIDSAQSERWASLQKVLETALGYRREGDTIAGFDEGIAPDFVNGEIRIHAGWDNWSGHYLLAVCVAGDEVLRQLHRQSTTP